MRRPDLANVGRVLPTSDDLGAEDIGTESWGPRSAVHMPHPCAPPLLRHPVHPPRDCPTAPLAPERCKMRGCRSTDGPGTELRRSTKVQQAAHPALNGNWGTSKPSEPAPYLRETPTAALRALGHDLWLGVLCCTAHNLTHIARLLLTLTLQDANRPGRQIGLLLLTLTVQDHTAARRVAQAEQDASDARSAVRRTSHGDGGALGRPRDDVGPKDAGERRGAKHSRFRAEAKEEAFRGGTLRNHPSKDSSPPTMRLRTLGQENRPMRLQRGCSCTSRDPSRGRRRGARCT